MHTLSRCLRTVTAALPILASAVIAFAEAPDHYYFFGERRALQLDASRVAVLTLNDEAARPALLQRGVGARGMRAMTIGAWQLADAPEDIRMTGTTAPLIADLAEEPAIEFVSPVFIDNLGGPMVVTPTLLVGFEDGVTPQRATELLAGSGHVVQVNAWNMPGMYELRSMSRSGYDVLAEANRLAQLPEVRFAEPDMLFTGRSALTPNDPGYSSCWGLHNVGQNGGTIDMDMDAPGAWDIETGDSSIIVVVLDTGVELDHPDLNVYTPGYDSTGESAGGFPNNVCDVHGTAVAGCVSGIINNGLGTVGIAPGCRVASARSFVSNTPCNGSWSATSTMTVSSLNWANSIGARVTNNSNFYGFTSSAIANTYAQLRSGGMVHFASAGNDFGSPITYPSSLPSVVSVAALGRNGALTSFSNFGTGLGISAPGESIYTTDNQGSGGYTSGDYAFVNGTSFASPYTAGVAALVLSKVPSMSAIDVENLLFSTAVDLGASGYDTTYGWGFVNAEAALIVAAPPPGPGAFGLLSPADATYDIDEAGVLVLTWEESTDADSYLVTIASDPGLTSPVIPPITRSTESLLIFGGTFDDNTTYYWGVTATNAVGTVSSTPVAASFTTGPPPPACDGDITGDDKVTLADFSILAANFGATGLPHGNNESRSVGDLTDDGDINLSDFSDLAVNFGAVCS
ncbi:MAG: S8 family serine peptidase [Planctomycetota bacterium]